MPSFTGRWITMFGPMDLEEDGDNVQGTYHFSNQEGTITGQLDAGRLTFRYQESNAAGEGSFVMVRPGRFEGQWRPDGQAQWLPWIGERDFEGIWETSFGLCRLVQGGEQVIGFYEGAGNSSIEGECKHGGLVLVQRELV